MENSLMIKRNSFKLCYEWQDLPLNLEEFKKQMDKEVEL